jgi:type II secretory pathway pseudopilin PulG
MNSRRTRLLLIELFAALALIAVLGSIFVPALCRTRGASRRASCANNLKQIGLAILMFTNESKGERLPPLSPIPNNWMIDAKAMYPEYVSDLSVFVCPDSPFPPSPGFTTKPHCVTSLYYVYTGYMVLSDERAVALFDAAYENPAPLLAGEDLSLNVPVWADSDRPPDGRQEAIPIMWDRVPLNENELSHKTPRGCNVLHMDAHVRFVPYSYYNNSRFFPVTRISAETFGSVLPRAPQDCYSE